MKPTPFGYNGKSGGDLDEFVGKLQNRKQYGWNRR